MSQSGLYDQGEHHPLIDLIKQLHGARGLVVGAYERSGVDLDEKTRAQIEPLIKAHLLRLEGSGGLRLNQKLQKVFDAALRKNRIAAINTDLKSELQAAELAMSQLQDVKMSGRVDELFPARDEVEQHLLSMYDILDDSSTSIYNRVTSSYGMQRNPDIRQRENELYNRQLTQLVDSYHQMRNGLYEEPFTLDQDIMAFIGNLDIRCMEVVDRITRTQNTIRDNLFKVRELEQRARKIRAVADHFRQHPGFEASATASVLDQHPFFRAITPLAITATPDLADIGVEESCAELVAKLSQTIKTTRPQAQRKDSTLTNAEQAERVANPSALDVMAKRLLASCHEAQEPVSALSYWRNHEKPEAITDLHESEWLYGLALYMDADPMTSAGTKTTDSARLYIHAKPRHALSGTLELVDLFLYPALMSQSDAGRFIRQHHPDGSRL